MRPPPGASMLAVMLFVTALIAKLRSRRVSVPVPASHVRPLRSGLLIRHIATALRCALPCARSSPRFFAGAENVSRCRASTPPERILTDSRFFLIVSLLWLAVPVQAQIQSETRFEYDGAGNIVRILTETNDAPPTIFSLTPGFINRGSSVIVVARGDNLVRADVVSLSPDLFVDNVVPTLSSVRFRLRAALDAPIGPAILEFRTRLGTASAEIFIAERTPVISTSPNPIVLAANGQPVLVTLLFDQPFEIDQTYQVSIRDTGIATVQETTVTLAAGSREVAVNLTGLNVGTTTFDISQPENFIGLGISVIVVPDEPLPPGNYEISTPALGIVINVDEPLSGPLSAESAGVGVVVNLDELLSGALSTESEAVGVVVNVDEPFSGAAAGLSEEVGVAFGATGTGISPTSFAVGTTGTLTITGSGLDEVIAVSLFPGDGITQTGPLSVDLDGSVLSIPLSVAAGAGTGIRAIVLTTSAGDVGLEAVLEITP